MRTTARAAQQIRFITQNYQAAAVVAAAADATWQGLNATDFNAADVLGWAAAESGYAAPSQSSDSGLRSGNLDYFNVKAGPDWLNQVACPPGSKLPLGLLRQLSRRGRGCPLLTNPVLAI
jgi:hypothetical protein